MKAVIFARATNNDLKENNNALSEIIERIKLKFNSYEVINIFTHLGDELIINTYSFKEMVSFLKLSNERIDILFYRTSDLPYWNHSNNGFYPEGDLLEIFNKNSFEIFPYYPDNRFHIPWNSQKIWRYMNLQKFIDLIQSKQLYYSKVKNLQKNDKYEGLFWTEEEKNSQYNIILEKGDKNLIDEYVEGYRIKEFTDKYSEFTFVNCWHISDVENYAMWKIYSDNFGIAVQSSYSKLCDSFNDKHYKINITKGNEYYIFNAKVNYIDYQKRGFYGWLLETSISKRLEFEYEKELRSVICRNDFYDNLDKIPKNIRVEVDLDKLIDKIYLSPYMPNDFKKNIIDLCKIYGLKIAENEESIKNNIIKSSL